MIRSTTVARRVVVGCVGALMAASAAALAQGQGAATAQPQAPSTPRPVLPLLVQVQNMYTPLKTNLTKAAEQFPEEKYGWRPTPDVRTWAQLFNHVIDDNFGFCAPITGDPKPPTLDNEGQPTDAAKGLKKADIVKMLKDSFAVCDKAFTLVTPENMNDRNSPTSSRSRVGALIYSIQHISEHYGNAVTYMRLNGLVPPSSQPATGRGGSR
jgi:uncharacterized damage-inducible protein DinB